MIIPTTLKKKIEEQQLLEHTYRHQEEKEKSDDMRKEIISDLRITEKEYYELVRKISPTK